MKNASKALDCIGCMCCYSACPVIGLGDLTDFAGPAPLVQLGQTALDPRNDPAKVARSLARTGIFQLRILLQVRGGLPGQHSDRQPRHRAAEGQSGGAGARHGEASACVCAQSSQRAAASIRARWCCACRDCGRLRNMPRVLRLLLRGKIDPIKTFLRTKDAGGCGSRAPARRRRPSMKFAYYPGCSARIDLRRAQRGDASRSRHGSVSSSRSWRRRPAPARASCAPSIRSASIALNVRILALAERAGLPLMTICNTCTLNLLDAHAAFVDDPELARDGQRAARRGGPALQRTHPHQPLPLGAVRGYRHRPAARSWWSSRSTG